MSAGAASPEELEAVLEDACLLLNDTTFLTKLFDVDAVLLARGRSQGRGRPAIANVIIGQLRDGGRMDLPRNRREHRGPPQGTDSSKHLE